MSKSRVTKELLPELCMFRSVLVPDTLTQFSSWGPLHIRKKRLDTMELRSLLSQMWGHRGRELVIRAEVLGQGRLDLRNRAKFYLLELGQQISKYFSNFFLHTVSAYQMSVSFRTSACTHSASVGLGKGLQSRTLQFFLYIFQRNICFMHIKQKRHMYFPLFIHMVAYHTHCFEPWIFFFHLTMFLWECTIPVYKVFSFFLMTT